MIKLDQWRQLGVWLERPGPTSWNEVLEPRICVGSLGPLWLGPRFSRSVHVRGDGKESPSAPLLPPPLSSPLQARATIRKKKHNTTRSHHHLESVVNQRTSTTPLRLTQAYPWHASLFSVSG